MESFSKCLHGQTQDANEALHTFIRTRCPKNILVGRSTLKIRVNSAISNLNDSSKGLLDVLNYFDLPGAVTTNKGVKCNTTQVK